ncbi:unnamed protein product [Rhizophagus irregularis]|nr:unnamed protein product [Rhizophagus irregularis]
MTTKIWEKKKCFGSNTLVESCNDLFQTDKNPTDKSMQEAIYTALVNEHPDEVEKIEKTKDGWFSRITKEVLKSNERTSNNCLFIITIVDLMFDPNIQTTVLSGKSIIKCMAEKAKANEDMELQQKSNKLDNEKAENENVENDEIAKDRNADENADDENFDLIIFDNDFVLEREVREALGDEDDFVLEREVREALGDEDDFVLKGDLKVLGNKENDFVLKKDRKVSDNVLEVCKAVSSSSKLGGMR